MDIILIPGLWLDGSSWEKVVPVLERAGHRAHPLTLPGMEAKDADRSAITLRDHVDAVVSAIDAVDAAAGEVVLVGHSAGGAVAHAAVDARPDRVSRVVYVGGFPTGDGDPAAAGIPAADGEVPLLDWSAFDDDELADLDDVMRAEFAKRAIPSPERVTRDPQQLTDERRYDVPATVIATEFTSETLRGWIEQGLAPVREFAKIRDVEYVDLPTGHWPQFTRPEELGRAIVASFERPASGASAGSAVPSDVDEHGRREPPLAGDETSSILGFLEHQRATLAWKCAGLDAAGLQATTAVSSMTLAGCSSTWPTSRMCGAPGGCTDTTPHRPGTQWTGTPTATGTGTRPPTTPPSSCTRSGRTPSSVLVSSSPRRWPRVVSIGRRRGSTTGSASRPACGGSCCT